MFPVMRLADSGRVGIAEKRATREERQRGANRRPRLRLACGFARLTRAVAWPPYDDRAGASLRRSVPPRACIADDSGLVTGRSWSDISSNNAR